MNILHPRVSTAMMTTSASSWIPCKRRSGLDKRESPMAHIHPVIVRETGLAAVEGDESGVRKTVRYCFLLNLIARS